MSFNKDQLFDWWFEDYTSSTREEKLARLHIIQNRKEWTEFVNIIEIAFGSGSVKQLTLLTPKKPF